MSTDICLCLYICQAADRWADLSVNVRAWFRALLSLIFVHQYLCVCICLSVLVLFCLSTLPYLSVVCFWLSVSLPVYWSDHPCPIVSSYMKICHHICLSLSLSLFTYLWGYIYLFVGMCLPIHDPVCLRIHICRVRFFL